MPTSKKPASSAAHERPPIVVVMGHIDHGKSTILDYIRKTNIVDKEAGGITQHVAAYEVNHKDANGMDKRITFIDTPGHAAFEAIRRRGARVADIAILVVSAEEGVKAQTLEALAAIKESGTPYIVAINKIDRPGADVERTIGNLVEKEVYLEGRGGSIPYVAVSAKTGEGIPALLEMISLVAEMEELRGDANKPAEGFVVEAHLDVKKGISGTLIINDGSISRGMFIVAGSSLAPVRIMEDCTGAPLTTATFSSPITIIGFDDLPDVGAPFRTFTEKKDAEVYAAEQKTKPNNSHEVDFSKGGEQLVVPVVIKADATGTVEAIVHELEPLSSERIAIRVVGAGVGAIGEADVKRAGGSGNALIVGFNVKVDPRAREIAGRTGVTIETFSIIYKLTEWMQETLVARTPKRTVEQVMGRIKILRLFSANHNKQVIGGRVETGVVAEKNNVRIMRRDNNVGMGTILELQKGRARVGQVQESDECGILVESRLMIAVGDVLEAYASVEE